VSTRAAEVRFYVDADILGLAHVLAGLRSDVTYPGDPGATIKRRTRPACPIKSPAAKDKEWIGPVTARSWLILTRDGQIQAHPSELAEVREHGARMVALDTEQAHSTFDQLEIVMCRWRQILDLLDQPGPFIYVASRTKLRAVPLS
jgi:hypothetical protein